MADLGDERGEQRENRLRESIGQSAGKLSEKPTSHFAIGPRLHLHLFSRRVRKIFQFLLYLYTYQ